LQDREQDVLGVELWSPIALRTAQGRREGLSSLVRQGVVVQSSLLLTVSKETVSTL